MIKWKLKNKVEEKNEVVFPFYYKERHQPEGCYYVMYKDHLYISDFSFKELYWIVNVVYGHQSLLEGLDTGKFLPLKGKDLINAQGHFAQVKEKIREAIAND